MRDIKQDSSQVDQQLKNFIKDKFEWQQGFGAFFIDKSQAPE